MELNVPQEGDELVDSSTTNESADTQSDKKEEQKTIPYERFARVNKEKEFLKSSVTSLRSEINEIKNLLKQSKEPDYSTMTPKELENHIREQVRNEAKLDKLQEEQKVQDAEQFVNDFLEKLEDEGHEFDANELMKLAVEDFDSDLPKAWKAYQREQKALAEAKSEKAKLKAKEGESPSGKKGDSVKEERQTVQRWSDLHEIGMKYVK